MESEAKFIIEKWAKRRGWTDEQKVDAHCRFIEEELGFDVTELLDRHLAKAPEPTKAA